MGNLQQFREKTTFLDYETMEQPQVSDKIFTSERTAQMYGGLGSIINNYQGMLSGLLEVAGAVGLIVALCFSRPSSEGSLLSFAARPAVSVLLLLLFLFLTVVLRKREVTPCKPFASFVMAPAYWVNPPTVMAPASTFNATRRNIYRSTPEWRCSLPICCPG